MTTLKYKYIVVAITTILYVGQIEAQITVGADLAPEKFSILQVEGNTGALRLPQLDLGDRKLLEDNSDLSTNDKAKGLTIYNFNNESVEYWNGTRWASNGLNGLNALRVDGKYLKLGGALTASSKISMQSFNMRFNQNGTNTGIFKVGNILTAQSGKIGIGMDEGVDIADASTLQIKGEQGGITLKNAGTVVAGVSYILGTNDGTYRPRWMSNELGMRAWIIPYQDPARPGYSGVPFKGKVEQSGYSVLLPPGSWVVQSVIRLEIDKPIPSNDFLFVRLSWSDRTTASGFGGTSGLTASQGYLTSGTIGPNSTTGMATGSTYIINSSGQTKRIYLMIQNMVSRTNTGSLPTNYKFIGLGNGPWEENSIIVMPKM